jgi:large subunit ribosomal protein L25
VSTTETRLTATPRTDFGKGAARRVRRGRRIPAVIYGHGMAPLHVSLPAHDTMMALKHRNAVLEIDLEGTSHTTLAKHVQRDPVRQVIEHVDLIVVGRDERVEVDIPVTAHGTGTADAVVTIEQTSITVAAPATQLPEGVDVDVTGFAPGSVVLAKDLSLPAGVTLVTDPDTVVVHATLARTATDAEADAAADQV